MLTDPVWGSSSTGRLIAESLVWVVCFGALAIAYLRTKWWDRTWKERWERRHAASLEVLRSKIQRTLTAILILWWIFLTLFFVSVGFGLGPISDAIRGLEQEPPLVIILHARLSLLLLLFLGVVAGGVRLLRYRIRRINELLAA
jgi:hypothetical protein